MRNPLRSVWLKNRWYKQRLDWIFLSWPHALLELLQVVSPNSEINKKSPYNSSWVLDSIHLRTGRKASRFKESKVLFSLSVDYLASPEGRFCSENKWWTSASVSLNSKQSKQKCFHLFRCISQQIFFCCTTL